VTTALAVVAVLAGVALYVVILSRWPQDGPVTWSNGSPVARGFIFTAGASAVLALPVLGRALAAGLSRGGSVLGRVAWLLAASGVGAGAWALLDLSGWI
jgi:hypothetical protein